MDVWCPPGYAEAVDTRYPVLYMHDGQNLFDPALAYGGVDWGVDEAMLRLIREDRVTGAIIVGVWNSSQRWQDYMPQKSLESTEGEPLLPKFTANSGGAPVSDRYLAFLVEEVKPMIDATYRTLPDQAEHVCHGLQHGRPDLALCRRAISARFRRRRVRVDPLAGRREHAGGLHG